MLALLINVNRDSKTAAVSAEDIHPLLGEFDLSPEERREVLRQQMATIRDRVFEGKVIQIAPFIPVNHQAAEGANNGR